MFLSFISQTASTVRLFVSTNNKTQVWCDSSGPKHNQHQDEDTGPDQPIRFQTRCLISGTTMSMLPKGWKSAEHVGFLMIWILYIWQKTQVGVIRIRTVRSTFMNLIQRHCRSLRRIQIQAVYSDFTSLQRLFFSVFAVLLKPLQLIHMKPRVKKKRCWILRLIWPDKVHSRHEEMNPVDSRVERKTKNRIGEGLLTVHRTFTDWVLLKVVSNIYMVEFVLIQRQWEKKNFTTNQFNHFYTTHHKMKTFLCYWYKQVDK